MIKIKLLGRLGNQLFQFAFASLTAKNFNTSFILDTNDQPFDLHYFTLHGNWPLLKKRKVLKIYNKAQQRLLKNAPIIDLRDCRLELNTEQLQDNASYWGYYQDYRLYEPILPFLLKWFSVVPEYRKHFENKYEPKLREKPSIVVSFRLGDYQSFDVFSKNNNPPIVPLSWQKQILENFNFDKYNIFIISDDIQQVEDNLGLHHKNIEYVRADVPTQFLLLTQADYCIISNSTFAWWGAYLNTKAKKVFCPKYFLGFHFNIEYPVNIYPPYWEQITVSQENNPMKLLTT